MLGIFGSKYTAVKEQSKKCQTSHFNYVLIELRRKRESKLKNSFDWATHFGTFMIYVLGVVTMSYNPRFAARTRCLLPSSSVPFDAMLLEALVIVTGPAGVVGIAVAGDSDRPGALCLARAANASLRSG